jgi:hypothetical protein
MGERNGEQLGTIRKHMGKNNGILTSNHGDITGILLVIYFNHLIHGLSGEQ